MGKFLKGQIFSHPLLRHGISPQHSLTTPIAPTDVWATTLVTFRLLPFDHFQESFELSARITQFQQKSLNGKPWQIIQLTFSLIYLIVSPLYLKFLCNFVVFIPFPISSLIPILQFQFEKKHQQIEKVQLELKKDLKERSQLLNSKREEKLIRLKRDQRDQERRLQEQHSQLMKEYEEKAKLLGQNEKQRMDELKRQEEDRLKKFAEIASKRDLRLQEETESLERQIRVIEEKMKRNEENSFTHIFPSNSSKASLPNQAILQLNIQEIVFAENSKYVIHERTMRLRERHSEIDKHVRDFKTEREKKIEEKSEQIQTNLLKVDQKLKQHKDSEDKERAERRGEKEYKFEMKAKEIRRNQRDDLKHRLQSLEERFKKANDMVEASNIA